MHIDPIRSAPVGPSISGICTYETRSVALTLTTTNTGPCIDSRLLAQHLGGRHDSLCQLVNKHQADFCELGKVRFQIEPLPGSRTGQKTRSLLLTEDQAYLLLTYTRNSATTRKLKVQLVKAFRNARIAADTHKTEYLPTYHDLHIKIESLASGSSNKRFVHSNINKLVNKVAGVEPGQRNKAPMPRQALLSMAQVIAANALHDAPDHHVGYQRVKQALASLGALVTPPVLKDARG